MPRTVVTDLVVPKCHGLAFEVARGQFLRIHLPEGKQVGDCVFFNAHDHREWFHVGQTWAINVMLGTGNARSFPYFYSKPPRENVMLTVVEDTVRNHFGNMGGRCSKRLYAMRDHDDVHRSCQENLAEALAPHGIDGNQIGDVFNVFMNVDLDAAGGFVIRPPSAERGDYIEMRAEMDILGAISACPREGAPVNDGVPKSMGVTIFDGA